MKVGDKIGDIELLELLREDSYYRTLKGKTDRDEKILTIKSLGETLLQSKDVLSRFDSAFHLPMHVKGCKGVQGVVQRSLGGSDKPTYMIRRFVTDRSLADVIGGSEEMDVNRLMRIGLAIFNVLDNARHYDLNHGGLQPTNIFISDDERPKVTITDFEMSPVILLRDAPLEQFPVEMLYHLSPRMLTEPRPDPELMDDLYSLASILYLIYFKEVPFAASSAGELIGLKGDSIPKKLKDVDDVDKDKLPTITNEQEFRESLKNISNEEELLSFLHVALRPRNGIVPKKHPPIPRVGLEFGKSDDIISFEGTGEGIRKKTLYVWNEEKYQALFLESLVTNVDWLRLTASKPLEGLDHKEKVEINVECDPVIDRNLSEHTTRETEVVFKLNKTKYDEDVYAKAVEQGYDKVVLKVTAVFKPEVPVEDGDEEDEDVNSNGKPWKLIAGIVSLVLILSGAAYWWFYGPPPINWLPTKGDEPNITFIDPGRITLGEPTQIKISGKNFHGATAVAIDRAGDIENPPRVSTDGTQLSVSITVRGSEAPGTATITISTPEGNVTAEIVLEPPTPLDGPVITFIDPGQMILDERTQIRITGKNFHGTTAVIIDRVAVIENPPRVSTDGTQLTIYMTIDESETPGTATITVYTPQGSETEKIVLIETPLKPIIAFLDPWQITPGEQIQIKITGENFHGATKVTIDREDAVVDNPPKVSADGTQLSVNVTVPKSETPGTATVTLYTPQGSATAEIMLIQKTRTASTITSIDPPRFILGKDVRLVIKGKHLQDATEVDIDRVATVNNPPTVSDDGTQLTVYMTVRDGEATGAATITVRTPLGDISARITLIEPPPTPTGFLFVDATIRGGECYIDGERLGTKTIPNYVKLRPGKHRIRIVQPSCSPGIFEYEVEVFADQEVKKMFELECSN